MDKSTPRLKLKESHHAFLEKAKALNAHLMEDWEQISPVAITPNLRELFQKSITDAETVLAEHQMLWRSDTPEDKEKRLLYTEATEIYLDLREAFSYLSPSEFDCKEILRTNPIKPPVRFLSLHIATFVEAFKKMANRPPFITDEQIAKAEKIAKKYINMISAYNMNQLEQVFLRETRDEAFRELRRVQKLVKETGRYAFRKIPEMKRRYR